MLDANNSAVPLYMQIYNCIVNRILLGEYEKGSKIPSQRELSEEFGVSTVTTRKALEQLAEDEIITTKQGKGSYVTYTRELYPILSEGSFTKTCQLNNLQPETKILSCARTKANQRIASALKVCLGTDILYIQRLRLMEQKACILERDYFKDDCFFLEAMDLDNCSLLNIILTDKDNANCRFNDYFDIAMATSEQAEYLKCDPGFPLLKVSQIIQSDEKILYYNEQFIRSDYYHYATSMIVQIPKK